MKRVDNKGADQTAFVILIQQSQVFLRQGTCTLYIYTYMISAIGWMINSKAHNIVGIMQYLTEILCTSSVLVF